MPDAKKSLNALAQAQIQTMLEEMEHMGPSDKRATASAIKALAESLSGLSGMDDTFQTWMRDAVQKLHDDLGDKENQDQNQ